MFCNGTEQPRSQVRESLGKRLLHELFDVMIRSQIFRGFARKSLIYESWLLEL